MTIQIRKFKSADLKQVLELCREIRNHHRDFLQGYFLPQDDALEGQAFLDSLLPESKRRALVADEDGVIKGLLLSEDRIQPFLEKPHIGYIHNFGVLKNCRGQGIAQQLMKAFCDDCRQRGIEEIKLGVFNANTNAYKFYEKFGFVPQEQKMSFKL